MLKIYAVATLFCLPSLHAEQIQLTNLSRLELKNAQGIIATLHGKSALKLTEAESGQGDAFAAIKDVRFRSGTIDLEVAGAPLQDCSRFRARFHWRSLSRAARRFALRVLLYPSYKRPHRRSVAP